MHIQTFMTKSLKWKKRWLMNKFSNRYSISKYLATACILVGFAFYTSCSPDSGLGKNILPNNNTLSALFIDSSKVVTSLVLEDTIPTNGIPVYLLGSYNDPIFGPTKASVYTQVLLPGGDGANPMLYNSTAVNTSTDTIILDSVVFHLSFGSNNSVNYYGSFGPQTIQVYSLSPKTHFTNDSAYYSTANIRYDNLLGQSTVFPDMANEATVYYPYLGYSNPSIGGPYPARFSVKLNHNWGKSWLDTALSAYSKLSKAGGQWDTLVLKTAAFERNFPGLYITSANPAQFPGQGGLWYVDPFADGTNIMFYCRAISNTHDTTYFTPTFAINAGGVGFSHFDHDYTHTPFYGPPNKKDSVYSPNLIYVQGMGGVKTKIDFPYIMNWVKKGPVIVNQALVEIPVNTSDIGIYSPPDQLYLIGINDTSTVPITATFTLPDQYSIYYGGTYDAFNNEYVFNITRYVQSVFDKKTIFHGLYLVSGSSSITANRFVGYGAKGNGAGSPHMRLKIYCTPLKS